MAIDRHVTGEQANIGLPIHGHEIAVLLIAQGLDRRGVERLTARCPREMDRELTHDRLAAARRCGQQHVLAGVEGLEGPDLEVVKGEVVALPE